MEPRKWWIWYQRTFVKIFACCLLRNVTQSDGLSSPNFSSPNFWMKPSKDYQTRSSHMFGINSHRQQISRVNRMSRTFTLLRNFAQRLWVLVNFFKIGSLKLIFLKKTKNLAELSQKNVKCMDKVKEQFAHISINRQVSNYISIDSNFIHFTQKTSKFYNFKNYVDQLYHLQKS